MKAKDNNGVIKIYPSLPKSHKNIMGGFDLLPDSEHERYGFYDLVTPNFSSSIQELGDIYFDTGSNVFTYPVIDKTWTASLDELKEERVEALNKVYHTELAKTDWYVIRESETSQVIPTSVSSSRANLRWGNIQKSSSIAALTTKADVMNYDITNI